MSNSRSERRRQSRGTSSQPPRRRDPMLPVYITAGAIIVIVIGAVFFIKWQQQNAIVAETSTPTPAPSTSGAPATKPVQLADGMTLGVPMIKGASRSDEPDTKSGGLGQPIDGITCGGMEYGTLHVHTHIAIFYKGKQVQIPRLIGGAQVPGCLYWIHTHFMDGIIHVESPVIAPEGSAGFDLGMFFDIWGQPLTRDDVAGLKGDVIAYVNGAPYDGELRLIPLKSHQQIVLEIGSPTVPPPNYIFPPND
jgi:hypothetical protein